MMRIAEFIALTALCIVSGFYACRAYYWKQRARSYGGNIVELSRAYTNARADNVKLVFTLGIIVGALAYFYLRHRSNE